MNSLLNETYQIESLIGTGGAGEVYRAYHKRLKKTVVIKKTYISGLGEADNRREADILKNLRHTYLPQVLDFIEEVDEGRPGNVAIYTVMDYIEGVSFQKLLDEGCIFTQEQARKYGSQLLEALVYLHSQRIPILHGDIKPDNIILTPEDNICLIDFNISGVLTGGSAVTVGYTPGYASPEQVYAVQALQAYLMTPQPFPQNNVSYSNQTEMLLGQNVPYEPTQLMHQPGSYVPTEIKPAPPAPGPQITDVTIDNRMHQLDARADIYSAGAFLYHLVTGRKPDPDPRRIIPLSTWTNFSDGFAAVIDKAMSGNPNDRFQTAHAMLVALQGYARADRRYRGLKIRQTICYTFILLGLLICVLVATTGRSKMWSEKSETYDELVAEMDEARIAEDIEQFDVLYETAVTLFPERLESYVERAHLLYDARQYRDVIDFAADLAETHVLRGDQKELISVLYYIEGSAWYELADLKEAVNRFQTALMYDDNNAEVYRDLAITLAQMGKTDRAVEILQQVEEAGVNEDQLELVRGEIAAKQGDKDGAERCFRSCIEMTDNEYVRMRAYILFSEVYGSDLTGLEQKAKLLEEARLALPQDQTAFVLEKLAQAYIDLYELTDNEDYASGAVKVFEDICDHGWASFITYNNLAVLYQETGKLSEAKQATDHMLSSYAERYETWKRLAYLEIAFQQEKEAEDRDYSEFEEYFEKAGELYEKQALSGRTDPEMTVLESVFHDLKQGGWLK